MTQREAANRLAEARWPDPESEMADIRRVYGPVADGIIQAQQPFLQVTEGQFRRSQESHSRPLGGRARHCCPQFLRPRLSPTRCARRAAPGSPRSWG